MSSCSTSSRSASFDSEKRIKKLFFEGKYDDSLELIRNLLSTLSDYDDRREHLVILGSQCLFELELGAEIQSFFETAYRRQLQLVPPTVFFVYINYLLHVNEYQKAIRELKQFGEKGKPMNKHEYQQWVKLIVYDGFINHRRYKKAIKFLKKQHKLDTSLKNAIMQQIKLRMAQDGRIKKAATTTTTNINDLAIDSSECSSDSEYDRLSTSHSPPPINAQHTKETSTEQDGDGDDDTQINNATGNEASNAALNTDADNKDASKPCKLNGIVTNIQQRTDRRAVCKLICIIIVFWFCIKIAKKNKKLIRTYLSDFRKLIIMSIGKSRISV